MVSHVRRGLAALCLPLLASSSYAASQVQGGDAKTVPAPQEGQADPNQVEPLLQTSEPLPASAIHVTGVESWDVVFERAANQPLAKGIGRGARALVTAGLLCLASWGTSQAQTNAPPPTIQPGGQPPAGMPQQQAPSLPVLPREQLEALDLPELDELMGQARPRLSDAAGEGITVSSLLAKDLQSIGEPNRLHARR